MTDYPTFDTPEDPPDRISSDVVLRVRADALSGPPPRDEHELKVHAEALPESITEPLEYLQRNAGLTAVRPAPTVRRVHFAPTAGALSDRVALVQSVFEATLAGTEGIAIASLPSRRLTPALVRRIEAAPAIDFFAPMPPRWPTATPAQPDPTQNLQWGLRAIGWFDAPPIDASGVRVGVVDSGIDTTHPALAGLDVAYDHLGAAKIDQIGHGTHVAGVIAAAVDDDAGIAGMARPRLSVWKAYPDEPQHAGRFYVDPNLYLHAMRAAPSAQVHVLNLSFAGTKPTPFEPVVVRALRDAGVLVVASMGNAYAQGDPTTYPASYDGVFAVGSTAEDRTRSDFSSTGPHIDLCAPGSNILSTLPVRRSRYRRKRSFTAMSGTSMAAAYVSAAAALLAAKHPDWTADDLAAQLRATAAPLPAMGRRRHTPEHGAGQLDLRAALR